MALRRKTVWGGAVGNLARSGLGRAIASLLVVLAASPAFAQARLPESLKRHVASKSAQPIEVIVHGSEGEIAALAARHGLRVTKRLSEGAVLQADAAQIASLSAEVDHLSRDVEEA